MVEPTTATRSTYEDYRKTPDDERWELLNGELKMPPAPSVNHQRIVGSLFTQISAFVSQSALGEVLLAPCDVVLSEENVVQPDLLFVSSSRGHIITHENVCGSPDLVVEDLPPRAGIDGCVRGARRAGVLDCRSRRWKDLGYDPIGCQTIQRRR